MKLSEQLRQDIEDCARLAIDTVVPRRMLNAADWLEVIAHEIRREVETSRQESPEILLKV